MSDWITDLKNKLGDEVICARASGHTHWGFTVGNHYKIVPHKELANRYSFHGRFGEEQVLYDFMPEINYGNSWEFVSAGVEENE